MAAFWWMEEVVNNLPTNVVKDMGADFILAVTLRTAAPDLTNYKVCRTLCDSAANLAVLQNELQQARLADLVLAIPVPNRSVMDFTSTSSLIEAGYQAAARNRSELEKLSLSPDDWQVHERNRKSRERTFLSGDR